MLEQCKKTYPGLLDFLSVDVLKSERAKAKDTIFDEYAHRRVSGRKKQPQSADKGPSGTLHEG